MYSWFHALRIQQELCESPEDLMRIAGEHMAAGWPQVIRYAILDAIDSCYDDPDYVSELRGALKDFNASTFMGFRNYHFEVDLEILAEVFGKFVGQDSDLLIKVVKAMTWEKNRGRSDQ